VAKPGDDRDDDDARGLEPGRGLGHGGEARGDGDLDGLIDVLAEIAFEALYDKDD